MAAAIRAWMLETDTTQTALASKLGVSQSRISRILAGDFSRRSDTASRLIKMAGVELAPAMSPLESERRLVKAFHEVWDGTTEGWHRIMATLESAMEVRRKRTG
jgi:transcriptional regulator with XRE-family HTH domain